MLYSWSHVFECSQPYAGRALSCTGPPCPSRREAAGKDGPCAWSRDAAFDIAGTSDPLSLLPMTCLIGQKTRAVSGRAPHAVLNGRPTIGEACLRAVWWASAHRQRLTRKRRILTPVDRRWIIDVD